MSCERLTGHRCNEDGTRDHILEVNAAFRHPQTRLTTRHIPEHLSRFSDPSPQSRRDRERLDDGRIEAAVFGDNLTAAQAMEGGSSGTRHMRSQVGFVKVGGEGMGLGDDKNVGGFGEHMHNSGRGSVVVTEQIRGQLIPEELDVPRTANQCRRKWDSLLDEYKKIIVRSRTFPNSQTQTHTDFFPPNFDREHFKAIHDFVMSKDNRFDDTDPDSDTDPEADFSEAISQAQLGNF
ncbi:hypothetical protein CUMW_266810 [Citrus unshiu]|uniref:Myb-like domain-containing protein n=1 Tax=Citrus unshiu TaxID=55188 RepID=A0A2H5QW01_CITUN|nr:hypothetical protein CUMW_266810 [Citrus unshiu]